MKSVAAWIVAAVFALQGWAGDAIRLKNRSIAPFRCNTEPCEAAARSSVRARRTGHFIVQFRSWPDAAVREELARRGIRVVAYVPDSALMVSASGAANLEGLDVTWAGPLEPSDKLSPALSTEPAAAWLSIFHPDVGQERARAIARHHGFDILESPSLLSGQLLLAGSYSRLEELAAEDELAYILPASADLVAGAPVAACGGALTEAGAIGEYTQAGTGWTRNSSGGIALKYFFQSLTTRLDESTVRAEVERAFREWAVYANVTFAATSAAGAARGLDIRFARGSHGDPYTFDGSGGVLAHTFYPSPPNPETIAGDMHFDSDEPWRSGADVDLFSVALHEAGHALGLGHSDKPGAVMYPYYRFTAGLSDDDITGIRALYGAATSSEPATPTSPTGGDSPDQPSGDSPTQPAAPADSTSPTLRILSPPSTIVSTYKASIAIRGTAGDNVKVAAVRWSVSTGDSGDASGTTSWTATVPLLVGNNVVTVRAYDSAGNSAWRSITVVRR